MTKQNPARLTDPEEIVSWILDQNEQLAPINMVKFAGLLQDKFGGMENFAKLFSDLMINASGEQNKMRLMSMAGDIFSRAADRQEAEMTAIDLTDEQLTACVRHVIAHGDTAEKRDETAAGGASKSPVDGVDSFGV